MGLGPEVCLNCMITINKKCMECKLDNTRHFFCLTKEEATEVVKRDGKQDNLFYKELLENWGIPK